MRDHQTLGALKADPQTRASRDEYTVPCATSTDAIGTKKSSTVVSIAAVTSPSTHNIEDVIDTMLFVTEGQLTSGRFVIRG